MLAETVDYLEKQGVEKPEIALILGSGLGGMVEEFTDSQAIPYKDIPNFPESTVVGHEGKLVFGKLAGRSVVALQGRFHYYEGYDLQTVTYPVRVFKELGVKKIIITNAAGGINPDFNVGDLMIITDHINLAGANPLIGPNIDDHGPRFVDMSEAYSKRAYELLKSIGQEEGIALQEGVYTWFSGPTYETPAEIRFARTIGGDACGMSTVPETIVAKHCGMEVAGITCITNKAAGMQASLNHEEVVVATQDANEKFRRLVKSLVAKF
ncbi:purine-nucleoside phosphorylase [Aerococcus kribbianus]|uniref:Purine nucleoside phosphorylase n=1 Tax=Aerococcus kribbianus TaxID=2999064 RepID=A0A9X3FVA8_9LACT|nr:MULTISPECIES: purine-nucleoside phosphorylase [unclassified Aerococcus]MCZ0716894.1 purine-nucleoside phosphorylase [Aerococcus sp. YH-aer221]MCZ0725182.1 purine-nucleoside phosphorylase [Aerococcus sp. YH-aer222]